MSNEYKEIWKFLVNLHIDGVSMPRGARILSAQLQGDELCLWAEVCPKNPLTKYDFKIRGTGHQYLPSDGLEYLSTVQQGYFAWHVFVDKKLCLT